MVRGSNSNALTDIARKFKIHDEVRVVNKISEKASKDEYKTTTFNGVITAINESYLSISYSKTDTRYKYKETCTFNNILSGQQSIYTKNIRKEWERVQPYGNPHIGVGTPSKGVTI